MTETNILLTRKHDGLVAVANVGGGKSNATFRFLQACQSKGRFVRASFGAGPNGWVNTIRHDEVAAFQAQATAQGLTAAFGEG